MCAAEQLARHNGLSLAALYLGHLLFVGRTIGLPGWRNLANLSPGKREQEVSNSSRDNNNKCFDNLLARRPQFARRACRAPGRLAGPALCTQPAGPLEARGGNRSGRVAWGAQLAALLSTQFPVASARRAGYVATI